MRKFGLILLLLAAALFIILPLALGSALLFDWNSMVIFLNMFRELWLTLVPGFVILGFLLFFYDRITAFSEDHHWTLYVWLGVLAVGSTLYFLAYTARADSLFQTVDHIVPGDQSFTPSLQVFSIYMAFTMIAAAGIMLFNDVKHMKWDTLKSGSVLLGFLLSLLFTFLLHRLAWP